MSNLLRTTARGLAAGLTASCLAFAAAPAANATAVPDKTVRVLSINDFHGYLEPPTGAANRLPKSDGTMVDVGGSAYLATHVKTLRSRVRHNLTISPGDLVGGSPLLSSLFRDEPSIESLRAMGLDVAGVGNHEFDEGVDELLRIDRGGCHPVDGCFFPSSPFRGAPFPILAANVIDRTTRQPILPATAIRERAGHKIGMIGVTLRGTREVVAAAGVAGVSFKDEVASINAAAADLNRQGVKTIIAMVHEGGFSSGKPEECGPGTRDSGLTGPIVNIAEDITSRVDLIVTGHTHGAYLCNIADPAGNPRWVTSASSFGRAVSVIDLRISGATGDVLRNSTKVYNRLVTRDVTPDAKQLEIIAKWNAKVGPIAGRAVGSITADITRAAGGRRDRESSLSNLIADAQLWDTAAPAKGGAQLALMNPGGVRADLNFAANPAIPGDTDGKLTFGEIYNVQPFGNNLVTMTLTGAQIERTLEQQWTLQAGGVVRQLHLGISDGLRYSYDPNGPVGNKIDPESITLGGAPLDPAASYRVTVNSFLADGGDGFTALTEGTNRVTGAIDLDAFESFLSANSPVAPPAADRVTILAGA